jgi:hypothetical protein
MSTKRKTEKYVDPVQLVIKAAQEAEKIRHQEYSIQTLQRLATHNHEKLVPALGAVMQWALDLQREVNQIEAKLIVQLLKDKKQGGKRVS